MPLRTAILTPEERISEALFGLIMVITFTGSLSVAGASAGHEDVRTMLIGALGCNIAWGIIDAVMYLMGANAESVRRHRAIRALRAAPADADAAAIIRAAAPLAGEVMTDGELAEFRRRVLALPEPPAAAPLTRRDWLGALGVFCWVFAATFPVTLPFMLMPQVNPAMRVSNAVAVGLLAALGFAFGRTVGRNPWLHAVGMIVLGLILVALTIALGG